MVESFVKSRRGILEHLEQGRLTFSEFGVFQLLLLQANKANGVVWSDSRKVAGYFNGTLNERTAKDALASLKAKGYIKEFRQQGSRGSYPILVNKYEITVGDLKGCLTNAEQTVDWQQPVVSGRPDDRPEERREERPPYSRPQENKTSRPQDENQSSRERQSASPESSPESETPDRPPVDVEPKATPPTPDLPVYERAEDVPDFDKPRCLASRLWVCLGKPKHHEPKLRVWANDLRPCLEQFEFLEMWQAMRWATHEDTFWSGVIKGAANWAKNVEKIMDSYHAHLRGKANFERMQKQEEAKKVKKAPANYGSGKIVLENVEEL
jgi:hypothetical protein